MLSYLGLSIHTTDTYIYYQIINHNNYTINFIMLPLFFNIVGVFKIYAHHMKNPFLYSNLNSYIHDKQLLSNPSFQQSRVSQLEKSRTSQLIYDNGLSSSTISLFPNPNPFTSKSHQPYVYQSTTSSKYVAKQNPFINAKPYRHQRKEIIIKKEKQGLAKWEKQLYLSDFQTQNVNDTAKRQIENNSILSEREQKFQSKRIEKEKNDNSKSLKRTNTIRAQQKLRQDEYGMSNFKADYSFSQDQEYSPAPEKPSNAVNMRVQKKSSNKGDSEEVKRLDMYQYDKGNDQNRSSLINHLQKDPDIDLNLRFTNSKVYEENHPAQQFKEEKGRAYKEIEIKQSKQKVGKVQGRPGVANQDNKLNPYITQNSNQPPQSIRYHGVEYQMVKLM